MQRSRGDENNDSVGIANHHLKAAYFMEKNHLDGEIADYSTGEQYFG